MKSENTLCICNAVLKLTDT